MKGPVSLTALWDPVELDECLLPCLVDQLEGVHSKPGHVSVVERNTNIVLQECELWTGGVGEQKVQ